MIFTKFKSSKFLLCMIVNSFILCSSSNIKEEWKVPVIVPATSKQTGTIIFLHSLGDSGSGWGYALSHVRPSHLKIVCPIARMLPIRMDNSIRNMTAWFRNGQDSRILEDSKEMKDTVSYIQSLIEKEIENGISSKNIFIGGFAQGGAIALHVATSFNKTLGGLIGMSTWVPMIKTFVEKANIKNYDIPILIGHGDKDTVVPYRNFNNSIAILRRFSKNIDFKTYEGVDHMVDQEGMFDIGEFLADHSKP